MIIRRRHSLFKSPPLKSTDRKPASRQTKFESFDLGIATLEIGELEKAGGIQFVYIIMEKTKSRTVHSLSHALVFIPPSTTP